MHQTWALHATTRIPNDTVQWHFLCDLTSSIDYLSPRYLRTNDYAAQFTYLNSKDIFEWRNRLLFCNGIIPKRTFDPKPLNYCNGIFKKFSTIKKKVAYFQHDNTYIETLKETHITSLIALKMIFTYTPWQKFDSISFSTSLYIGAKIWKKLTTL